VLHQVLDTIKLGGKPLRVPSMYRAPKARVEALFSLDRDQAMKSMMRNAAAAKTGAMIDVGANVGQSLVKWASLDASRAYIGFEPNPASAFQCGLIIHLNQLQNHKLFPVGISDHFGAISLQLNGLLDPSASAIDAFRPEGLFGRRVDGLAVRGDDIIQALDVEQIAFLKIDVEGAELEVFRSFRKTIEKMRPLITFEVLPHFLLVTRVPLPEPQVEFRRARYAQIESLLKDLDYCLLDCSEGRAPEKVTTIQPGPAGSETTIKNYFVVSSDFEAELLSRWI
jgi:FkbM family methyltransferase